MNILTVRRKPAKTKQHGHPPGFIAPFFIFCPDRYFKIMPWDGLAEKGKLGLGDFAEQYLPEPHDQHVGTNVGPHAGYPAYPTSPTISDFLVHNAAHSRPRLPNPSVSTGDERACR
jgi:hypothetical protein